jgi:hypothetical protein
MAVRLSALCARRPLPPGRFLVLISVRGWVEPRAIVRLEGLGQLKKSNDHIWNRTRDLAACISIMPQPTTPPRAPKVHRNVKFLITSYIKTKFQLSGTLFTRKKNIRSLGSEKLTSWWRSKRERRWNTKNNTLNISVWREKKKLQNFLFWCLVLLSLLTINNNKLILSKLTHTHTHTHK